MATSSSRNTSILWCSLLLVVVVIGQVRGDVEEDKRECQGRLVSLLSSCLTFVSGESKYPVSTCCVKLRNNYDLNLRRCLCIVVRDRNDPKLGFNINTTLALSLPYICHVNHANVSDCPDLLHMDPNSVDAQVFLRFNSTSAVQDITASSNGPMNRSCIAFGTIGYIFMWMMFSVFFHRV